MQRCPNCGEENAETARFCSACGDGLAIAPAAGEERKVVSVLFVDLVGFTARSDRADPEDVRATLRVYHDRLKREIERFGGTVEKFVGDAVMAVFGAPVSHEDDAKRAVLAALRILTAIDELNEEHPELELAVRGAVNTGEAVVALGARPELGEGFVSGDVVNVASRLQGAAPAGGVVVGELTYRSTRDEIEYERVEPVSVKGKDEPIPIWRTVGARGRYGVDVQTATSTPLVGRGNELALLGDLFRRVLVERSPQLVTLSGEPGVGKSRLVQEFLGVVDDLSELVYWRQGRCLPYGEGITFWALGEVVKSHAGILENDVPEEAASKLWQVISTVVDEESERDWLQARLSPLVGLREEAEAVEREESFAAWTSFLEAIAAKEPLVVIIEDLHWADPALLAFIEHLADWSSGVPLFVLCTARPELYEREPAWGGGKRNHTALSLSPLSPDETAELIAKLLEQAVLPAETQTALLGRAGGNPLYAEEFIRMLIDQGILVRHGASWDLVGSEADIPVPESVQALIAARLDTLAPDRKALLHDAAVLGKVFWAGALAEMGGVDPRKVREGLHELARKELVRPARRPSIQGESEYAFWHLLIRDVAYGQIPRAPRAAKHRAAASWIERITGERVADSAELLAYHHERALELTRAVGEDTTELEALARKALLMAAERASRLDVDKSLEYCRRALAMTRSGQPERLEVLSFTGRFVLGGLLVDDTMIRETIEEARLQGDELAEGEAFSRLSYHAWVRGDAARQEELIRRSLEILERHPPGPELAFAYTRAAAAAGLAGRSAETLSSVERALPVVQEFGTVIYLGILLQFRGSARMDAGETDEGMADLREGVRIAIESAPAGLACSAHINLAGAVWLVDGPAQGLELYEQASEIGERRGAIRSANWARMESMWTLFDLGRWDELLAVGEGLLEDPAEQALPVGVLAETFRQMVLIHRGVLDGTAVIEERILPRAREIEDGQVVVPAFRTAALSRQARGDASGVVALVEEAHGLTRDRAGFRGWLLDDSARLCRLAGAPQTLRRMLDGFTPYVTRHRSSVLAAEAALAELEGNHALALERNLEVAERWKRFPHVFEHGHAMLGAGRCLLALGRELDATDRLRAARERFRSLGAVPLVTETDALLERATAKSS
ncbi:MAG TPA: adenylate/guanylate cyclase domain-containing protein [Actinomycetota bacterium]|nr:adenylate/guanylate cyclase domain-containing protein [Actinomycetota bacterium]